MIKVLHIISSLESGGGVQMVLKQYYQYMDKEKIKFDFVVHGSTIGGLEEYFSDLGSRIYHVTPKRKSFFSNRKEIREIIKNGKYDIIHNHQDYHGVYSLKIAKKYGVRSRIVHSHVSQEAAGIKKIIKKFCRFRLKNIATGVFGCSSVAIKQLMGEVADDYKVIHNALDLGKYTFSAEKRDKVRENLGLTGKFVIGHIGRFAEVKNHKFILEFFSDFKKTQENAKLVLVGDGPLFEQVKNRADEMSIADDIIFTGLRDDVPDLLQAMDTMVLPSLHEGLGIVVIEAQITNLPCLCSVAVPVDVDLTGNVKFLSLNNTESWVNGLFEAMNTSRKDMTDIVRAAGYDIEAEAKELMNLYVEMTERDNCE